MSAAFITQKRNNGQVGTYLLVSQCDGHGDGGVVNASWRPPCVQATSCTDDQNTTQALAARKKATVLQAPKQFFAGCCLSVSGLGWAACGAPSLGRVVTLAMLELARPSSEGGLAPFALGACPPSLSKRRPPASLPRSLPPTTSPSTPNHSTPFFPSSTCYSVNSRPPNKGF
jgi:hypothetical protein